MLEADQLKAAREHLLKLWRLIESNRSEPSTNTSARLPQPNLQPIETGAALENDELQEMLLEKEAERRERSTANENESVIEKMIHDFVKDKLVDRSTDVLKYWEDNRLLKHQLYVLAKVKFLNNKIFISIFIQN
jgi:hypothetical protein